MAEIFFVYFKNEMINDNSNKNFQIFTFIFLCRLQQFNEPQFICQDFNQKVFYMHT